MNAHPKTAALATQLETADPAANLQPNFAEQLVQAAEVLFPCFETGKPIDAKTLRAAMEGAFGANDTSGAWVWKDAYDAVEIAQVMMITRYGASMRKQAASPAQFLSMVERLSALAPSHTRRSEDSVRLQQFSTPLPLAAIVAEAAGFRPSDFVLEPSAGTGMLAVFGQIAGADIALNELAEVRLGVLRALFAAAPVSGHDAASIDDRLDRAITPSVIVMNPPFSAAQHVNGKFRKATSQHVLSALARLAPSGRLVVITGESFAPKTKSHQSTFRSIGEVADVVFSAAIAGKVFARHGTSIDTRLTVIDKRCAGDDMAKTDAEDVYHPLCETTGDLLSAVLAHCPARTNEMPPCPTGARQIAPKSAPRHNLHALRDAARQETRDLAAERAKHPFDSIDAIPLAYQPKVWTDPQGTLQDAVYEDYALQAFQIEGAATHPTSLVQSAAMASVPPPLPTYQPLLPNALTLDGVLSAPQLESVIYASCRHHRRQLAAWP